MDCMILLFILQEFINGNFRITEFFKIIVTCNVVKALLTENNFYNLRSFEVPKGVNFSKEQIINVIVNFLPYEMKLFIVRK